MGYDLTAGDAGSILRVTCKDQETDALIDLTGKTVKLRYKLNGGTLQVKTMTVASPNTDGIAEYQFAPADIPVAGTIEFDIRLNEGAGDQLTSVQLDELRIRSPLA